MAKENSNDPAISQPQQITLSKIHDLPGVFVGRQPDKSYGGLVTSIQAGGVKEPVVLRLREDGEYQLVTGYRRLRASELAKKQDIPALVYEMSIQEAQDYHHRVKNKTDMEIPGKLVPAPDQGQKADLKGPEKPTPAAPTDQDMEQTTIPMTPEKGKDKPAKGTEPPTDAAQDKEKAPVPAADDPADYALHRIRHPLLLLRGRGLGPPAGPGAPGGDRTGDRRAPAPAGGAPPDPGGGGPRYSGTYLLPVADGALSRLAELRHGLLSYRGEGFLRYAGGAGTGPGFHLPGVLHHP